MARILDAFCGAGGAGLGYHLAGFEVVGVDIEPQPNYPFEFVQADALSFLDFGSWNDQTPDEWFDACGNDGFAGIHASPPCQFATAYKRRPNHVREAVNLIPETRRLLRATGLPYVIENVEQARGWLIEPYMLCGSTFALDVRRHRLFETSFPLTTAGCAHHLQQGDFPQATNRRNRRKTVEIGVWRIPLDVQQRAMGVDWMTREELSQAIPPAYTQLIGSQLRSYLRSKDDDPDCGSCSCVVACEGRL